MNLKKNYRNSLKYLAKISRAYLEDKRVVSSTKFEFLSLKLCQKLCPQTRTTATTVTMVMPTMTDKAWLHRINLDFHQMSQK